MKVVIKYGDLTQEFENQANITIGNSPSCDIIVSELGDDEVLKLVYAQKYNNYVLMNVSQSRDILCNNKVFSKILVSLLSSINLVLSNGVLNSRLIRGVPKIDLYLPLGSSI